MHVCVCLTGPAPPVLIVVRKTRQPYLQASGGGRPTKVLSTHQFESRGSSDRQSAKVDIAMTTLSMAGVSRPGTAQSAQPTAIQRSPFSPYQVGLARPVPSSLHRESCEPRVHDSHARVYFPRAFATRRGRSINESKLFSCLEFMAGFRSTIASDIPTPPSER